MSREKQIIEEMAKSAFPFLDVVKPEYYNTAIFGNIHVIKPIENLYKAGYRKQEWVSVDERLPTDERNVLAYYGFDRGDGDLGMMFIGVLSYFAYDPKPHFQHEESGLRVTHWMPLPPPPEKEKSNG